jgi:hypothetical protein
MRGLHVIAAAAIGIGGVALGRWTAADAATVVRVTEGPPAATRMIAPACIARVDDADLRRLHDELVATAADTAAAPAPAPIEPPPPAPEQVAAAAEADRLLAAGFALGRWTDHDAEALRPQLAAMSPGDRIAALQRFAVAVDTGRLRVETTAAPF